MTNETTPAAPQSPKRRNALKTVGIAALAVVGLGAAGAATASAFGYGPGHGFGHGGFGHRGGFMGGMMDPARAEQGIERMMKHFAVEVDATPEQTQKLADIGKAAVKDLLPLRDKMRSGRGEARDLLTAPQIDRAKIEALRADKMATAEAMSKRVAKALGDAADVLTPEQRKKAAERMEEHRGRWARWHRG